jgi:hypothetical protein
MFQPNLGRWMQVDPSGFAAGDVNRYRALSNNPTVAIDPFGLQGVVDSIQIQGRDIETGLGRLDMEFKITIKGRKLTELEYTQYITINTEVWGGQGTPLSQKEIYDLYKECKFQYFKSSDPFANNVKDRGWGNGDAWAQFDDDRLKIIEDQHIGSVPFFRGGQVSYYPFRQTRKMIIKIRDKCNNIVKEHEWGFTFQNFNGEPKFPAMDKSAVGFYGYFGIDSIPLDKSPSNGKPK